MGGACNRMYVVRIDRPIYGGEGWGLLVLVFMLRGIKMIGYIPE